MDLRQGTCSSCQHSFRVPATITASKVRCPKCKAVVELAPAPAAVASAAGGGARRPARAGAAPPQASAERPSGHSGSSDTGHRHARVRRHAPPKSSKLPFVIGGVALVGAIAALALLTRGGSDEPPPAPAPKVLQKPDFSALPDLEPAEGTSADAWAQMNELMIRYITPPFDKAAERSGDLMMHKGKAGVPAILNAYKRLDLTTEDGRNIGWKMQTLLLQGLCGVNFGWRRGTSQEDVDFNAEVVERWFAAWNQAKLDDAAWAEIAKEAPPVY